MLVNPAAGGGRSGRLWPEMQPIAARSFAFEEHLTTRAGEATDVARQAADAGVRRILAVGGDGTLHEIINGLPDTRVAVAALPMGTGNDFARIVGWMRPPRDLFPALAASSTRIIDVGRVHDRRFLLVAGVGFDASVAHLVRAMDTKGGGTIPYLLTAMRQAFRFRPPELTVRLDGDAAARPAARLMVAVANAPSYAGGMRVCPPARLDDGLLHVVTIGDVSGWPVLSLLARVYRGTHLHDRRVAVATATAIAIDGPNDVPLHADGEPAGHLPAVFEVCPGALRIWVPTPPARDA